MKPIFLLLTFYIFSTSVQAQKPLVSATGQPDSALQLLLESEKQSYQPLFDQKTADLNGFTVASGNFDVKYYRCEWTVDPNIRYITGKVTSHFAIISSTNSITFDLSDTLNVDSVTWHGSKIGFLRPGNAGVTIQFPVTINTGQLDSVSIFYQGIPRVFINNSAYVSFTQATHNGAPVIYTLSESYGARDWWPCRNGLDDKADSIDIVITNPSAYQASSNGIMMHDTIIGSQKISYWKHRYPIASYLVAMAVSNYVVLKDTITTPYGNIPLVEYFYPENAYVFPQGHEAMQNSFDIYSKFFTPFPFVKEKYGFTQWNSGGGMEHQTNSFLGSPNVSLISHETAHQWFGDKITCGSWQDIWLNEGFAFYCQLLYNEFYQFSVNYLTLSNLCQAIGAIPNGSVWVDDTTTINRIFDNRLTYYKGGYLLHMLRWKLGDSTFFRGVRRYLGDSSLQYRFARVPDLQRNLEQESGQSLTSFFKEWYYGQGIPTNTVTWVQDTGNLAYVRIDQVTSDPSVSFYEMPVPVEFTNSQHDTTIVFNHIKSGQTFLANPGFKADTVIYDPHFWILSNHIATIPATCSSINSSDSLLPYYKVSWQQNTNQWITINVAQTNSAASVLAKNIPMYLHFTGNGKDTAILVNNISSPILLNPGFKADNSFIVAGSCFLTNNYSIGTDNSSSIINDIRIFPIPVSNTALTISLKNPSFKKLNLSLFDAEGKRVYSSSVDIPGMDELITVPVLSLPKGVYVLRLSDENKWILTKKILRL
jgi:hypothetical protein